MSETAWVEVDSIAESLYRAAGHDPFEGSRPIELASALGLRVIVGHAMSLPGLASLCRVNGQWTIYLRGRASELREDWGIAHELAEWTLNQEGYVGGSGARRRCSRRRSHRAETEVLAYPTPGGRIAGAAGARSRVDTEPRLAPVG